MLFAFLLQVPPGADTENPWAWFALVLVPAVAFLARVLLQFGKMMTEAVLEVLRYRGRRIAELERMVRADDADDGPDEPGTGQG